MPPTHRWMRARRALADYWEELLSGWQLTSGEEKLDRMVNIWNQYQCMVTFNMSRSAAITNPASAAAWDSVIPVRICSASCI